MRQICMLQSTKKTFSQEEKNAQIRLMGTIALNTPVTLLEPKLGQIARTSAKLFET